MKKGTISLRPAAASLKEMPEIDFSAYRVRRNPYADRIAREGAQIVHTGPSSASLKEMPEVDFNRAKVRPNKFAFEDGDTTSRILYGKGRPRKGTEVGPTPARSLRLPLETWKALEREASKRATTVHALLRELVVEHVARSRQQRPA